VLCEATTDIFVMADRRAALGTAADDLISQATVGLSAGLNSPTSY
jgi:histidinol dehydrogenase